MFKFLGPVENKILENRAKNRIYDSWFSFGSSQGHYQCTDLVANRTDDLF